MNGKQLWAIALAMSVTLWSGTIWTTIAAADGQKVSGVILHVEANGLSLMNSKESVSLAVAADTAITLDGEPAMLADLRPGWKATATYIEIEESGQKKVKSIVVLSKQRGGNLNADPSDLARG